MVATLLSAKKKKKKRVRAYDSACRADVPAGIACSFTTPVSGVTAEPYRNCVSRGLVAEPSQKRIKSEFGMRIYKLSPGDLTASTDAQQSYITGMI